MMPVPLIASGDPVLFLLFASMLLIVGAVLALGITGCVLIFGKSEEKRKTGKKLLVAMALLLVVAAIIWVSVVGFD